MSNVLQKYLPEHAVANCFELIKENHVHLKIVNERQSRHGDYRRDAQGFHLITVNSSLNKYRFLITLIHEIAHLVAFEKYGRRISPHGAEWKQTFREMLLESLTVYAEDLRPIILKFSKSPKAKFMASPDLVKYFHVPEEDELLYLENLIVGDVFVLKNKVFVIEETTKKRYLCRNLKSGLKYKVNTLARVRKIDDQYEKQ